MKKYSFVMILMIAVLAGCTIQFPTRQSSTSTQQTTPPSSLPQDFANSTPEGNTPTTNMTFDFTSLKEEVAKVEQIVNQVQRKETYMENRNTYQEIKLQIKQVELQIETMENQIERAYHMGSLDQSSFWTLTQELDTIEDRLDFLEDSLELRLGVDD